MRLPKISKTTCLWNFDKKRETLQNVIRPELAIDGAAVSDSSMWLAEGGMFYFISVRSGWLTEPQWSLLFALSMCREIARSSRHVRACFRLKWDCSAVPPRKVNLCIYKSPFLKDRLKRLFFLVCMQILMQSCLSVFMFAVNEWLLAACKLLTMVHSQVWIVTCVVSCSFLTWLVKMDANLWLKGNCQISHVKFESGKPEQSVL